MSNWWWLLTAPIWIFLGFGFAVVMGRFAGFNDKHLGNKENNE